MGFSAFTLIMLWIQNQLSYDMYNVHANRIYRVTTSVKVGDTQYKMGMSAPPLAGALQALPEVQKTVRLSNALHNVVVRHKDRIFNERDFFYVDSTFFQVFTQHMIEGNPSTALVKPYSIVITESMARKYFGNTDPLGKVISVHVLNSKHDYQITGVMQDMPPNSQFHAYFLASFSSEEAENPKLDSSWGNVSFFTYVLLRKNASINSLEAQFPGIIKKDMGKRFAKNWSFSAQKLTSIHLHSHLLLELEPNGSMSSVYIFGSVGILILLLAVINFITLSTSLTTDRAREIGVRKTLGAGSRNLLVQFAFETALIILASLIFSVLLTEVTLPLFNQLFHQSLKFTFDHSLIILSVGVLLIFIGCSYPALYFSSFQTNRVLSKSDVIKPGGVLLRKRLVVAQFSIAIILIAFTFKVNHQLRYVMSRSKGFNENQVLVVPLEHESLENKYPIIKNEFSQLKGVQGVTASNGIPGDADFSNHLGYQHKDLFEIRTMAVGYNFIQTMQIPLLSGRNFSKHQRTDLTNAIIINEAAARKLKALRLWGKRFNVGLTRNSKSKRRVIGVVKNFNYRPLYYPVQPMLLYLNPGTLRFVEIKIAPVDISGTIKELKQKWQQLEPGYPFVYKFLRDDLQQLYQSDKQLGNLFNLFSILAIFIGCLGLFGLASYTAEKRTKEIGIRKVLGASVSGIVILLSNDFLKLVAIGFLIAVPVAWYAMHKWLANFAYHVSIGVWTFAFAGALAMFIALFTVSWRSMRAALMNPVKSLRNE